MSKAEDFKNRGAARAAAHFISEAPQDPAPAAAATEPAAPAPAPAAASTRTVNINVRVAPEVKQRLEEIAAMDHRTLSSLLAVLFSDCIAAHDAEDRP